MHVMDAPFTDAELEVLALAADPDRPIDPDAEPFGGVTGSDLDVFRYDAPTYFAAHAPIILPTYFASCERRSR